MQNPLVGVVMGSQSDWPVMQHCHDILTEFEVPHECKVVSAPVSYTHLTLPTICSV